MKKWSKTYKILVPAEFSQISSEDESGGILYVVCTSSYIE